LKRPKLLAEGSKGSGGRGAATRVPRRSVAAADRAASAVRGRRFASDALEARDREPTDRRDALRGGARALVAKGSGPDAMASKLGAAIARRAPR